MVYLTIVVIYSSYIFSGLLIKGLVLPIDFLFILTYLSLCVLQTFC